MAILLSRLFNINAALFKLRDAGDENDAADIFYVVRNSLLFVQ